MIFVVVRNSHRSKKRVQSFKFLNICTWNACWKFDIYAGRLIFWVWFHSKTVTVNVTMCRVHVGSFHFSERLWFLGIHYKRIRGSIFFSKKPRGKSVSGRKCIIWVHTFNEHFLIFLGVLNHFWGFLLEFWSSIISVKKTDPLNKIFETRNHEKL